MYDRIRREGREREIKKSGKDTVPLELMLFTTTRQISS